MTSVRTARERDLPAVADLHVAAIEAFGPEAYDYEAVEAWAATDDQPAERYDLSAGHWVVAERGGDVAGFGHLDPDAAEVVAVYVHPDHAREGVVPGEVVAPRGEGGFGYDPIFEYDGTTFAEMDPTEKNAVSHRGRALEKFAEWYATVDR